VITGRSLQNETPFYNRIIVMDFAGTLSFDEQIGS
jgi:hypothetical protein